jgi:hypothetical protein
MVLSVVRWATLLWGCLCVAVMAHFSVRWFPHALDVRYNEMQLGFVLGAFYGWPSWLMLPLFAFFQRKSLSDWHIVMLLTPLILAAVLYFVGRHLSAGGL